MFSIFAGNIAFSQVEVGYQFDVNGQPFHGYYDFFTYMPDKTLSTTYVSNAYEIGFIYDSLGNKTKGLLHFDKGVIYFKSSNEAKKIKYDPGKINAFVMGVDSFFIASNFESNYNYDEGNEFIQYISEFDGLVFAVQYEYASNIAETYIVKSKENDKWEYLPNRNLNKKNREILLKYFGHIPELTDKINDKSNTGEDIMLLIRTAEYNAKRKNADLIYFDKYWSEISKSQNAKYYARITNIVDSNKTFEYYFDSVKLYTANYSSFSPNIKNGQFISYYPDGNTRQIIEYKNNEPKQVYNYTENGLLSNYYKYVKVTHPVTAKLYSDIEYISVYDSNGINLIDSSNKFSISQYDSINKYWYTHNFYKKKLVSSYRLSNNDTIYRITSPINDIKIKSLQNKFEKYLRDKNYLDAISENAQGTLLLQCLINKDGFLVEYKFLNSIHPQIDSLTKEFIQQTRLSNSEYKYDFDVYKRNNKKQLYEVV